MGCTDLTVFYSLSKNKTSYTKDNKDYWRKTGSLFYIDKMKKRRKT